MHTIEIQQGKETETSGKRYEAINDEFSPAYKGSIRGKEVSKNYRSQKHQRVGLVKGYKRLVSGAGFLS